MPVLVWIKGEEPTYKVYHTVGKSKAHLGWRKKAVLALYQAQYYFTAQKNGLWVLVCVVFGRIQLLTAQGNGFRVWHV